MASKMIFGIELSDKISAKLTKITSKLHGIKTETEKVNKKLSLTGVAARVGLGIAIHKLSGTLKEFGSSIVEITGDLETMGMTLEVVTGSAEQANALFSTMREWARTSPLETKDVVDSFVRLQAIGVNPTIESMETLGNVALIFGRQMTDVLDGFVGLNKRTLRQMGIDIDRTGKKAVLVSGDIRIETEKTSAAIRKGLLNVWEKRFPDALQKASETQKAKFAIMKSNLFELKAAVGEFFSQDIKDWADAWGQIFNSIRISIDPMVESLDNMYTKHDIAILNLNANQKKQNKLLAESHDLSKLGVGIRAKHLRASKRLRQIHKELKVLKTEHNEIDQKRLTLEGQILMKQSESTKQLKAQEALKKKETDAEGTEKALEDAKKATEAFEHSMAKSIASHKFKVQLQKEILTGKEAEAAIDKKIAETQDKLDTLSGKGDLEALEKKKELFKEIVDISSSIGGKFAEGIADGERGMREHMKSILNTMIDFIEKQAIAATAMAQINAASKVGLLGPAVLFEAAATAAAISGLANVAKAGISSFADGTNGPLTRPTIAEVGERGRELVKLPAGAEVINNQQTKNFSAQPVFNLYVNGERSVDNETIKYAATALHSTMRELERQGRIEKGLLR